VFQKTCYLLGKGTEEIRRRMRDTTVKVAETLPYGYILQVHDPDVLQVFPDKFRKEGRHQPEENILFLLRERNETCAFVESCTGGLCAVKLTAMPGSSDVFWGGWIVYSNTAKIGLGVSPEILERHGAVSKETVIQLAEKGRERSGASWCVSVSGIAGPTGGSTEKPAGTVWIGIAGGTTSPKGYRFLFSGTRAAVREKAGAAAFILLEQRVVRE
jgi:PncC family amidohydrolase